MSLLVLLCVTASWMTKNTQSDKTVLNKTYRGKHKKKRGETKIRLNLPPHLVSKPTCYPRKLPWFTSVSVCGRVLVVVFHKFGQMTQSKPQSKRPKNGRKKQPTELRCKKWRGNLSMYLRPLFFHGNFSEKNEVFI